jgi:serine/threonine protein kinase
MIVMKSSSRTRNVQENIFVDELGHAKIGDFGLTVMLTQTHARSTCAGRSTERWTSPEVLEEGNEVTRTTMTDIFSFGRVIYAVGAGFPSCIHTW